MRIHLYLSGLILFITSCGDSNRNRVIDYEIIHREQHLGEYLQLDSDQNFISVSRDHADTEGLGLVRIRPEDFSIEVIDETASEARDILISNNHIAFRDGSQLRYHMNAENFVVPNFGISKLRAFDSTKDHLLFIAEDLSSVTNSICLSLDGVMESSRILEGRVIRQIEPSVFAIHTDAGLKISSFSGCPEMAESKTRMILKDTEVHYLDALKVEDRWHIVYLDEEDGTLRHLVLDSKWKVLQTELIDGVPHESYVGVDLALFQWGSQLGVIYMDGWKLQPKFAIQESDASWRVEELDAYGAAGFYARPLEVRNDHLIVAWHNFRTSFSNQDTSYEDFVLTRIDLRP